MSILSKRNRVLHLITKGVIAGAELHLVNLAPVHEKANWDVRYATLYPAGEMNRRIGGLGEICYALNYHGASNLLSTAIDLACLIREQEVDILHTHLVHAGLVGIVASRIAGKPIYLVHTRHHADALYKFGGSFGIPLKAKIDGWIARRHDRVCAVSKAAQAVLIEREGVRSEKTVVTYPGIDIEGFRARVKDGAGARIRDEFGIGPEQPLIGVVAHLVPKKGHRILIEAMPAIRAACPNVKLLLVGDGPERTRLLMDVQRLGLGDAVVFAGLRRDVPDFLSAVDLVAQPSLEEGLPASLIEAMALAKPVVASAISGIPELVQHGRTGLLVPPGRSTALSDAILALLADPGRRREMGHAGLARAQAHFTIERMARQYEAVWADLLGASSLAKERSAPLRKSA